MRIWIALFVLLVALQVRAATPRFFADNFSGSTTTGDSLSATNIHQLGTNWVDLTNGGVNLSTTFGAAVGANSGVRFWNTNGTLEGRVYMFGNHSGTTPEIIVECIGSLALVPASAGGEGAIQIGKTGGDLQYSLFQYGSDGTSSRSIWAAASGNGASINAASNGPTSCVLQVFNPSQTVSGGAWIGGSNTMNLEPNRFSMNVPFGGRIMHARYTNTTAYSTALSFGTNMVVDYTATTNTLLFYTTNASGSGNYEKRVFLIRSGPNILSSLTYPSGWATNMSLQMPTNLQPGQILRLELESVGTGETNILVGSATVLSDNSFTWDSDAQDFFTRAAITDNSQKVAVNGLVVDLKANNFWTRADCIYPFVGGTSNSCAQNLKANSFNIAFTSVGVTYDANGITGNASTGRGNTQFNPSSGSHGFTQNSASMMVYCGTTAPTVNGVAIGSYDDTGTLIYDYMQVRNDGPGNIWRSAGLNSANFTVVAVTGSDWRGPVLMSRTNSTTQAIYDLAGTGSDSISSIRNLNRAPYVLDIDDGSGAPSAPSNVNLRGAYIGGGIFSDEKATFFAIWDKYEAALGRKVP